MQAVGDGTQDAGNPVLYVSQGGIPSIVLLSPSGLSLPFYKIGMMSVSQIHHED